MNNVETVLAAAQRLQRSGAPYALVSVIKAVAPASARPGDKAVVTADGTLQGWVGGGCAQPAVIRTVRQALLDGQARVIRIAPSEEGQVRDLGDVLEFGMACHSGGTLELFVDPVMPRPSLVVIGASPVALSLCNLAPHIGFDVTLVAAQVDPAAFASIISSTCPAVDRFIDDDQLAACENRIPRGAWVVVATQGRRDLQALNLALGLHASQVSFVASARKARVLKDSLLTAGADADQVEAIVAPAGYPMAAATPEEIALSVLAAVVSHRRQTMRMADTPEPATTEAQPARAEPVSPVQAAPRSCCGGGATEIKRTIT